MYIQLKSLLLQYSPFLVGILIICFGGSIVFGSDAYIAEKAQAIGASDPKAARLIGAVAMIVGVVFFAGWYFIRFKSGLW